MTLPLAHALKIRSMVYVAGEAIPNFWPMRNFIHHNPLHGLEHLPFEQGVSRGQALFHGKGFLERKDYQKYLESRHLTLETLQTQIKRWLADRSVAERAEPISLLTHLMTRIDTPLMQTEMFASLPEFVGALQGQSVSSDPIHSDTLKAWLTRHFPQDQPLYERIDALFGLQIGETLDELLIKSLLDFFDEDQSVWGMPGRDQGLWRAWRQLALHNLRFKLRGLHIERLINRAHMPETMIALVMEELGIPESTWVGYFRRELTRLHGWAGFIRWRSRTRHYYWQKAHPADLVDFLAVRLTLALALLADHGRLPSGEATDSAALASYLENDPENAFLQYALHSGRVLPEFALETEETLATEKQQAIHNLYVRYTSALKARQIENGKGRILELFHEVGIDPSQLDANELHQLLQMLRDFETEEGMLWLRALEESAAARLLATLRLPLENGKAPRPFAQALFCIDTRSEPMRRHLEASGDYETFGIAGFFGVPMSFIELGKGNETHLSPAVVTPKNLTLEMAIGELPEEHALSALQHALHELKESVAAPFATVEAIGLLFGLDMFGKTLLPLAYHEWRKLLEPIHPPTRLLLDQLSREQADSVIRAVQRGLVASALRQDYHFREEDIPDDLVRELREAALHGTSISMETRARLGLQGHGLDQLVERLRTHYRINMEEASQQMEQLSRIGFSLREQTNFVDTALRAIGLTQNFSRFVLLVGHGSTSQNNPYESALDCGACGGNNGLTNARALAQMANKQEVREALRERGIVIPDDTWFVPALHNTTTDEIKLHEVELLPPRHLIYIDRLHKGLRAAQRLCAQERAPTLTPLPDRADAARAERAVRRNAFDWSQVRPEWGLARNAYFIIGRRELSRESALQGRAFLHSYDWRIDRKHRLLENILTGPLVVAEWINMEHYFSTVDNARYGSGSKVYHNVAGRFGVMSGNLGDLRTGLPAQTVLKNGQPYHEPIRLITLIEAPFALACAALEAVSSVNALVRNGWVRLLILDPETGETHFFDDASYQWMKIPPHSAENGRLLETLAS